MSDIDEYDAYNISFDPEILPYIIELPQSQQPSPNISPEDSILQDAPASPKSTYSDEFFKYDLSEFTAEELAALDATIAAEGSGSRPSAARCEANGDPRYRDSGGPAVEIEVEKSSDEFARRQTSPATPPVPPSPHAGPSTETSKGATGFRTSNRPFEKNSHYARFRRGGTLAVTDLSAPSWCEVQFEYGLLQKRSRKLEDRPASFTTAKGKVIDVDKKAAKKLDKTAKRGTSVHKALEREIHPEQVPVQVATQEERWALRLVQMVQSVQSLIEIGKCREMPVFGVIQGQIVTGIIDEVQRRPLDTLPTSPTVGANDRKRERPDANLPSTPSKARSKKARRSPSPSQPSITTFFSPQKVPRDCSTPIPPAATPPPPMFRLKVIDTKSRKSHHLPPSEDMLPAKLQLMIYHRLLSRVLADPTTSMHALDFDSLWAQVGLSPLQPFSSRFHRDTGLNPSEVANLADVTRMWRNAVEMLSAQDVDDTLTVVYRTQVKKKNRKNGTESEEKRNIAGLLSGHGLDVMRQVLSVLHKVDANGPEMHALLVEKGFVLQNDASSSSAQPADPAPDTLQPPTDSAQSATEKAVLGASKDSPEVTDAAAAPDAASPDLVAASSSESESELGDGKLERSRIIGVKTFTVDDRFLDRHLTSILEFWYGKRPPKGVGVSLTRRCTWCEYHDGCEWRETKAEEAQKQARERSGSVLPDLA